MSMLFPEGASLLIVIGFYAVYIVLRLVFLLRVDSLVSFFFPLYCLTYIHIYTPCHLMAKRRHALLLLLKPQLEFQQ